LLGSAVEGQAGRVIRRQVKPIGSHQAIERQEHSLQCGGVGDNGGWIENIGGIALGKGQIERAVIVATFGDVF
jgi:hypothetical protein